ncbi:hypothetical protein B5S25_02255 [Paenibacillus larvae subsp. pulvifaciens]|uniref:Uncharacterized protein n=2 Tax=Paenibacillus larvae subsp. larvae TaxID=147375 RepID=A0A2L1U3T9_9BACL|nr:hypothetical protein B5S25_02255 [Paenibacillus larvae subsp. pulvifaciens]AVF27599.1 hypothetical protein ERICIII_03489 [Paenibacillus larvae subsp. larvae]MBH0344339.1 hypothetical protein [Paenibacillus larvae]
MLENCMVEPYFIRKIESFKQDKPTCDCGAWAAVSINGKLRCWDCAEDEGVELLIRRRVRCQER